MMYSQSLVCLVSLIGANLVDAAPEPIRNGKDLSDSASELDLGLTSYTVVSSTSIHNCAAYSANDTANATQNYASCYFTACGGTTVIVSGCGECSGDQYLVLYQSTAEMATDDDACGMCAQITYTVPGDSSVCNDYEVHEGCTDSESCSGTVSVYGSDYVFPTMLPSPAPSTIPTVHPLSHSVRPTRVPTTFSPSASPSEVPSELPTFSQNPTKVPSEVPTFTPSVSFAPSYGTITCPAFYLNNYYNHDDYVTCTFSACGGSPVTLSTTGNNWPIVTIFDSEGYQVSIQQGCSICSYSIFTPPGSGSNCQEYTIHESCYLWYYACSGTVTVTGNVITWPTEAPTKVPTMVPTLSQAPTPFSLYCPYFSATDVYPSLCSFTACGNETVSLSLFGGAYQYFSVTNESGSEVTYTDGCNACTTLAFIPARNSSECQDFVIHEGCQYGHSCAGYVQIFGDVKNINLKLNTLPTSMPTIRLTNEPALAPTEIPWRDFNNKPSSVYGTIVPVVVTLGGFLIAAGVVYYLVFSATGSSASPSEGVGANAGTSNNTSTAVKYSNLEAAVADGVEMT